MAPTLAEIDKYFDSALALVKTAGVLVQTAFQQPHPVDLQTKESDIDLVTETDKAVEVLLIAGLKEAFPDHEFLGEESAAAKMTLTDAPTWMIDPIDGTTNFVHRLPFVCVCVGLYVEKKPVLGIVYNPILQDLYSAKVGQGAYKNGFRIHVSGAKDLSKSLVITYHGGIGAARTESYLKTAENLLTNGFRGGRSFGSAALNMCFVAQGSCDAYYEIGIHCWDMAASGMVVTEAGGVMMDPSGTPLEIMGRRLLTAATPELAAKLTTVVVPFDAPRDD